MIAGRKAEGNVEGLKNNMVQRFDPYHKPDLMFLPHNVLVNDGAEADAGVADLADSLADASGTWRAG